MTMLRILLLILTAVAGIASHPRARAADFEGWVEFQREASAERLMRNVSPPGTSPGVVVASPSKADPDYFFHWVRDAALVMETVRSLRVGPAPDASLADFAAFSRSNQRSPALSGLGEPKYHVDGTPYAGP